MEILESSNLPQEVFTEHHHDIKDIFRKKILSLLSGDNLTMSAYGIEDDGYMSRESLKIEFSEKVSLDITLRRRI